MKIIAKSLHDLHILKILLLKGIIFQDNIFIHNDCMKIIIQRRKIENNQHPELSTYHNKYYVMSLLTINNINLLHKQAIQRNIDSIHNNQENVFIGLSDIYVTNQQLNFKFNTGILQCFIDQINILLEDISEPILKTKHT